MSHGIGPQDGIFAGQFNESSRAGNQSELFMNIRLPQIQFPAEISASLTAKFEEQKKTKISSGMHKAQIDREKINLHKILRALDFIKLLNSSANMQACLDNLENAYNTLSNTSDSFDVYLHKLDKEDPALKDVKFSTRLGFLRAELEAKKTPVKKINELATSVFQRLRDATAQFIPPEQKSLLVFQRASLQKKRFEQDTLRGGCLSPCKVASPFPLGGKTSLNSSKEPMDLSHFLLCRSRFKALKAITPWLHRPRVVVSAAKRGHLDMVARLLQNGAQISEGQRGQAVCNAAYHSDLDMVARLLQNGAQISKVHRGQAVCNAAGNGHLEVVERLLQNDAQISYEDRGIAVRIAAGKGHLQVVEMLLQNGSISDEHRGQAVRNAAVQGHFQVIKRLLQNGARILPYLLNEAAFWLAGGMRL
jgi:hypothetical protein